MKAKHPLGTAFQSIMIKDVPSYGNKLFYSLGFLSMTSFLVLIITGTIMALNGPTWWLTSSLGGYLRSVHLWATQAFVLFILLHLLVVFFTSGFKKPRRLTWVLGVLMLFTVLVETEFGYVLRGDYSSQWRSLQGADFYNGSGLGKLINPLNFLQIYGIHIVVIPLTLLGLLGLHYLLVRVLGIAKPYRKDVAVKTVPANHRILFVRGGVLVGLIMLLAIFLPSPYIKPTTIESIAQDAPALMGRTLVSEFDYSSDTATYLDNIDPYNFDTRAVFVAAPYAQLLQAQNGAADQMAVFAHEPVAVQKQQVRDASQYYAADSPDAKNAPHSPVMTVVAQLTAMAQAGLYEPALNAQDGVKGATYVARFLSDTGVLEDKATVLAITTDQYGMVREESGRTPGAWWLAPIGLLNHTVLANDSNGDRDGAIIFGSLLLTMMAFPFIPYLNQLPDKLKVYKLIWRQSK
ncbi:MAG TPA: cytochrome b N-terminal domain-containing protein [Candidatus Saccharimonadales bacterium]|nr:cytochrome b N-terminal domain-containing protein [Candidatus Saccharimonadales bacterium]